MSEDRREALKIIGAIGATCAFPFSADELYGQHAHPAAQAPLPARPRFFSQPEMETVTRMADLIVPATETPGAVAAGVPAYIDLVVSGNRAAQRLYREGLQWLDGESSRRHRKRFVELSEEEQVALLEPLCRESDQLAPAGEVEAGLAVKFFRAVKSMTADGYFTSRIGLVDELGYRGNTVLAEFPSCIHEH